jgi:hypothetical protein
VRLGAALRRAYQREQLDRDEGVSGGRSRPRAHIRRAHWHTFLAGPGRTERRVRWLPPIAVNVEDGATLPATIRPVMGDGTP